MKALLVDNVHNSAVQVLNNAGIDTVILPMLSEIELCKIIHEFDAVLLRNLTFISENVIANAKNLKVVGRVGAGLDNVDLQAAKKAGICVISSPDGNTIATAEQTMALMLALSRHIPSACASAFMGKWERSRFTGNDLYGKTLGIIGFGRIGSRVAHLAQAFGMNIIVYSLVPSDEFPNFNSLEKFLPLCDYISLHVPKTPQTVGMINSKTIALMKKGVKIINCARGGLAVEKDLAEGIEKGIISGVAVDVFENEPEIKNSILLKYPDYVVAAPHLGANTVETQTKVATDIATQVVDVLFGKNPKTPVCI